MSQVLGRCEVISLTHTPRNIGQINIQILWYIPTSQSSRYTAKHFQKKGGDINEVFNEALAYLNGFVAPASLVSVSVFEDDHPCPANHYHVVVYHKGEGIAPLEKPADI
jgi:hypothetical protein